VGAAGELATQFNLTGWQKGESYAAAKKCFKVWLLAFGDKGNREDRAIKAEVRAFFELHGASRFDNANDLIMRKWLIGQAFIKPMIKVFAALWY
jgi:hypothetical protein